MTMRVQMQRCKFTFKEKGCDYPAIWSLTYQGSIQLSCQRHVTNFLRAHYIHHGNNVPITIAHNDPSRVCALCGAEGGEHNWETHTMEVRASARD